MNNYILISRTFEEITPESCEIGDFSKTGFIEKRVKVSFSELVRLMRDHKESSCYPDNGDVNTWYSSGFYISNYQKYIERNESIHFHRQNTANCAKYWKYARLAANK